MFKRSLITLTLALCALSPSFGQTEAAHTAKNASPQTKGHVPASLLVPYSEKIADFSLVSSDVTDGLPADKNAPLQFVNKVWTYGSHGRIDAKVGLFKSADKAQRYFQEVVRESSGLALNRYKNGFTLGDAFKTNGYSAVCFTMGRVFVLVNVIGSDISEEAGGGLTEALARGIVYNLAANSGQTQVAPAAVVSLSSSPLARPALVIDGNAWAPLASLQAMGVQVARTADGKATLSYQGRHLVIAPLSSKAHLEGTAVDLDLPVLLQNDQIIVPITSVAKALRLRLPTALR